MTHFFSKLIKLVLSVILSTTMLYAQKNKEPLMKFGVIADIQYCNCETQGSRFYRNSLDKLDKCIEELNRQQVDFTVNLGDLVDRDSHINLDSVLIRQQKLNTPIYNTTGNHDYGGVKNNQELYKKLNMPSAYYSFEKADWLFIMLNTNEVAEYANIEGSELKRELDEIKQIIKSEGRSNGAIYNGGISKVQMQWLKKQLDKSKKEQKNVIIFTHHPLAGIEKLTAFNDKEMIDLISTYSSVKCVISGHHHPGAFAMQDNISFITTEGMVETDDQNAYAIVEIHLDKIEFKGFGRTKSYVIRL